MGTNRPMKRYTVQYLPHGGEDGGSCWAIVDKHKSELGGWPWIEGGYSRTEAIAAAAFHNYQALGAGPWKPYRRTTSR